MEWASVPREGEGGDLDRMYEQQDPVLGRLNAVAGPRPLGGAAGTEARFGMREGATSIVVAPGAINQRRKEDRKAAGEPGRDADAAVVPAEDGWLRWNDTGALAEGQAERAPFNPAYMAEEQKRLDVLHADPDYQFAQLCSGLSTRKLLDYFDVNSAQHAMKMADEMRSARDLELRLLKRTATDKMDELRQYETRYRLLLQEEAAIRTAAVDPAHEWLQRQRLDLWMAVVGTDEASLQFGALFPAYMVWQYDFIADVLFRAGRETPEAEPDRALWDAVSLIVRMDGAIYGNSIFDHPWYRDVLLTVRSERVLQAERPAAAVPPAVPLKAPLPYQGPHAGLASAQYRGWLDWLPRRGGSAAARPTTVEARIRAIVDDPRPITADEWTTLQSDLIPVFLARMHATWVPGKPPHILPPRLRDSLWNLDGAIKAPLGGNATLSACYQRLYFFAQEHISDAEERAAAKARVKVAPPAGGTPPLPVPTIGDFIRNPVGATLVASGLRDGKTARTRAQMAFWLLSFGPVELLAEAFKRTLKTWLDEVLPADEALWSPTVPPDARRLDAMQRRAYLALLWNWFGRTTMLDHLLTELEDPARDVTDADLLPHLESLVAAVAFETDGNVDALEPDWTANEVLEEIGAIAARPVAVDAPPGAFRLHALVELVRDAIAPRLSPTARGALGPAWSAMPTPAKKKRALTAITDFPGPPDESGGFAFRKPPAASSTRPLTPSSSTPPAPAPGPPPSGPPSGDGDGGGGAGGAGGRPGRRPRKAKGGGPPLRPADSGPKANCRSLAFIMSFYLLQRDVLYRHGLELAVRGGDRSAASPRSNWQWLSNCMLYHMQQGMRALPGFTAPTYLAAFPRYQGPRGWGIAPTSGIGPLGRGELGAVEKQKENEKVLRAADFERFSSLFYAADGEPFGRLYPDADEKVPGDAEVKLRQWETLASSESATALISPDYVATAMAALTGLRPVAAVDAKTLVAALDGFCKRYDNVAANELLQEWYAALAGKDGILSNEAKEGTYAANVTARFIAPTRFHYTQARELITATCAPILVALADRLMAPQYEEPLGEQEAVKLFSLRQLGVPDEYAGVDLPTRWRIYYAQKAGASTDARNLGDLYGFIRTGRPLLPYVRNSSKVKLLSVDPDPDADTDVNPKNANEIVDDEPLAGYKTDPFFSWKNVGNYAPAFGEANFAQLAVRPTLNVLVEKSIPGLLGLFAHGMATHLQRHPLQLPRRLSDHEGTKATLPFDLRLPTMTLGDGAPPAASGAAKAVMDAAIAKQRLHLAVLAVLQSDEDSGNDDRYFGAAAEASAFARVWARRSVPYAELAEQFVLPGDATWQGPRGLHRFLQTSLRGLATVPLLLDYLAFIYGAAETRTARLASLRVSIGNIEQQLQQLQQRQIVGAETPAQSAAAMREAAQRLYVPTAQHMARPHISGRMYFTPFFQAALQAGMHVVRDVLGYRGPSAVSLEELTSPRNARLSYAFACFIAGHETDVSLSHPNQYRKDVEYRVHPGRHQARHIELARAIAEYLQGGRTGGGSAGAGGSGGGTGGIHIHII